MREVMHLDVIVPKWRLVAMKMSIYPIAALLWLRVISEKQCIAAIDAITTWVVKGVKVNVV